MAMANTAFKTRTASYRHSMAATGRLQRAEKPLFQAFLRPSFVKTTDRHCIKVTTTIDITYRGGQLLIETRE